LEEMMFKICNDAQKQIEEFVKFKKASPIGIIAVIFLTFLSLLPMMLDPIEAFG
jgi:hypothetical protein